MLSNGIMYLFFSKIECASPLLKGKVVQLFRTKETKSKDRETGVLGVEKSEEQRRRLTFSLCFRLESGEITRETFGTETEEERGDWLAAIEQSISPSLVKPATMMTIHPFCKRIH